MELEETKLKLKLKHNSEIKHSAKLKYNREEKASTKTYFKLRTKYKNLKESKKSMKEVNNLLMNKLNQSNNDVNKLTEKENVIGKLTFMVNVLTEEFKDAQTENTDLKYQIAEEEDLAKIRKKGDNEIAEEIRMKYEDTINNS